MINSRVVGGSLLVGSIVLLGTAIGIFQKDQRMFCNLNADITFNVKSNNYLSKGRRGVSVRNGESLIYSVKSSSKYNIAGEIVTLDNTQRLWSMSIDAYYLDKNRMNWTSRANNTDVPTNLPCGIHTLTYDVLDSGGRRATVSRPFFVVEH